jgi:hypothetical protein
MKNLAKLLDDSIDYVDNLASRDKIRPPKDGRDHYKGRDYPYNKVRRFLESRIGKKWDSVFSEFVHLSWIKDEEKTREKIGWDVVFDTLMKDGKVWFVEEGSGDVKPIADYRWGGGTFYVHPITKCLSYQPKKKTDFVKKHREEEAKTLRILGDYHQLVKVNGIWHEVKGEPVKSEIIEIDGLHYRPLIGLPLPSKTCKVINGEMYMGCPRDDRKTIGPRERMMEENDPYYRRNYYRISKNYDSVKITHCRQLNSKELKKHGLKNDVKPITHKKCEICGNYGDKEPCYHQLRQSL